MDAYAPPAQNLEDIAVVISYLATQLGRLDNVFQSMVGPPKPALSLIAGQGRGSKKSAAKLKTVGNDA